jgi:hypothetical protein
LTTPRHGGDKSELRQRPRPSAATRATTVTNAKTARKQNARDLSSGVRADRHRLRGAHTIATLFHYSIGGCGRKGSGGPGGVDETKLEAILADMVSIIVALNERIEKLERSDGLTTRRLALMDEVLDGIVAHDKKLLWEAWKRDYFAEGYTLAKLSFADEIQTIRHLQAAMWELIFGLPDGWRDRLAKALTDTSPAADHRIINDGHRRKLHVTRVRL